MMRNVIKAATAVILTIILVTTCAYVFHSKSWYPKMNEFYESPGEYDVWFLGSSHAIMSTLPEELYSEYGIRSYNLACYGQTMAIDYWMTRNLFRISKPDLVVMDVGGIASEEKYSEDNLSSVRKMITSLPLSVTKYEAINDLFEGDLREEMIFPFSSDHYNWEYLNRNYFRLERSYDLGADQNVFGGRGKEDYILVTPATIPDSISELDTDKQESLNCGYLRKLIELCRENNVEVLLVKSPLSASDANLKNYNKAFSIGDEYGIPHLNGFEAEGIFDGDTDLWDERHLNSLGARKFTHLLGDYITENYPELAAGSETDDKIKAKWDNRYTEYLKWLDTELPLQSDLYSYLMLCTHPQYSVSIEMSESSSLTGDDVFRKLVNELNIQTGDSASDEMLDVGDKKVHVLDKDMNCDIRITVFDADGSEADTAEFVVHIDSDSRSERLR